MTSNLISVHVKNCRGGNALVIECKESEKVSDLAAKLHKNATLFDISPDDINLNILDIYQPLSSGKKKLEFFDRIAKLRENDYLVEFDHHPIEKQEIRVKYIKSINPIKIRCGMDDAICDLSNIISTKLGEFPLASEEREQIQAEGSEIQLFHQTSDGSLEPLDPLQEVSKLPRKYVVFDVLTHEMKTRRGKKIKLYVKHSTSRHTGVIDCWEKDTVADVIKHIKNGVDRFGLLDTRDMDDPQKIVVLVKPGQKAGDVPVTLEPYDTVGDLRDQIVEFRMEKKLLVEKVIIDEIEALCVGQTIAFFGAAGHGKSSTINTIGEVVPGVDFPLADVWKGTAAGTIVISPYEIKVGSHKFTFLDVPGNGFPGYESQSEEKETCNVLRWILRGEFPKDAKPNFWATNNMFKFKSWLTYIRKPSTGKVQMAVIVQNATCTPDKLGTLVVSGARQEKGNGIPVAAVMTHVDKLKDDGELQKKITELSEITGIDEKYIFPISNKSDKGDYLKGSERGNYVLSMLKQMLARSKRYKSES